MDEKIRATINKIRLLASQNDEFKKAMRELFGKNISASVASNTPELSDDIKAIRDALEIRANVSIRYEFINNQRLRDQLIIDNLRMENAALNLTEPENERFYIFCVNAFYQIENIVNYFFHKKYPDINNLLSVIESQTSSEMYPFNRKGTENNVGDVPVVNKLNAISHMLFPSEIGIKIILSTLRKVRNEGEHRCATIIAEKDESNYLYKFFQTNTFNSIRFNLIKLVNAIKADLSSTTVNEANDTTPKVEGVISSVFPGAKFVSFNGKNKQVPNNLMSKVKMLNKDDKVRITLSNNDIIDIEPK